MEEIIISTEQKNAFVDITEKVQESISKRKIRQGICTVFTAHATAAIVINENYDPNIGTDTLEALAKLIPAGIWKHDAIDGNGDSHIKASILGPSETIPVNDGKLVLGRWQAISLVELDGPKERRIIVEVAGK